MIEMLDTPSVVQERHGDLVYHIDTATGEVLHVDRPGFHVDSVPALEWLMERLSEQDAQIAALNARKAAVCENLDIQIKQIENKRKGLLYKYENELVEVARQNLPEGKRTFICPFGQVKFTKVAARLKVADPEKALHLAKTLGWENAIKRTEEFQISKLDAEQKQFAEANIEGMEGFEMTPATESFKVETGIG